MFCEGCGNGTNTSQKQDMRRGIEIVTTSPHETGHISTTPGRVVVKFQ